MLIYLLSIIYYLLSTALVGFSLEKDGMKIYFRGGKINTSSEGGAPERRQILQKHFCKVCRTTDKII